MKTRHVDNVQHIRNPQPLPILQFAPKADDRKKNKFYGKLNLPRFIDDWDRDLAKQPTPFELQARYDNEKLEREALARRNAIQQAPTLINNYEFQNAPTLMMMPTTMTLPPAQEIQMTNATTTNTERNRAEKRREGGGESVVKRTRSQSVIVQPTASPLRRGMNFRFPTPSESNAEALMRASRVEEGTVRKMDNVQAIRKAELRRNRDLAPARELPNIGQMIRDEDFQNAPTMIIPNFQEAPTMIMPPLVKKAAYERNKLAVDFDEPIGFGEPGTFTEFEASMDDQITEIGFSLRGQYEFIALVENDDLNKAAGTLKRQLLDYSNALIDLQRGRGSHENVSFKAASLDGRFVRIRKNLDEDEAGNFNKPDIRRAVKAYLTDVGYYY